MSLTSCYRYILELPIATLNDILKAALSESDAAEVKFTQNWNDIPINGYTANISAIPADQTQFPSILSLTSVNLGVILHLTLELQVSINELPELDKIIYQLSFDLPGILIKDSSVPPVLFIEFPSVTAADLNLVVTGGNITLTPDLIEPRIHAMYAANPSLGHNVQNNVPWIVSSDPQVQVTTDIFDDPPGSPDFRGAITVEIPDQDHIIMVMPGHFRIQGLAATYINTDMTLRIKVNVERLDGIIRLKFSTIQSSDVTVIFVTSSIYDIGAKPILASNVAQKMNAIGDQGQTFPESSQIKAMIIERLVTYAGDLKIPIFKPEPPADPTQIDLTTFIPMTVNQEVLALQLVPLNDGTSCDTPDVFAKPTGFALAISAVEAKELIKPITENNLGDRNVDGHDITLNHLNTTLSDPGEHGQENGHIWIDGDFDVHVSCWPDPNITFSGPIFLTPQTNPDGTVVFTAQAGNFDASDACCSNLSPTQIAALIEGTQSTPFVLPSNFSEVGRLTLTVTSADIFKAGIVVNGDFLVTTNSLIHSQDKQKTLFWLLETVAGNK